jgi:catechol 2,3-dioxygenase-like lactoylglutathione lyase family enzyme
MPEEVMIPALPCRSIDEVLDFYVALGFEVSYRQERPNTYAVVKRGGIEIHFFTMKGYEPSESYSTCLVMVPDVAVYFEDFTARVRAKYGKKLVKGIPRMTALYTNAEGGRSFNVIDPGGNWIRFFQRAVERDDIAALNIPPSSLSKALAVADILAHSHGDLAKAIKTLDTALAKAPDAPAGHRVLALVSRAVMAVADEDTSTAAAMLAELRGIELTDDERAALRVELQRADELEQAMGE